MMGGGMEEDLLSSAKYCTLRMKYCRCRQLPQLQANLAERQARRPPPAVQLVSCSLHTSFPLPLLMKQVRDTLHIPVYLMNNIEQRVFQWLELIYVRSNSPRRAASFVLTGKRGWNCYRIAHLWDILFGFMQVYSRWRLNWLIAGSFGILRYLYSKKI